MPARLVRRRDPWDAGLPQSSRGRRTAGAGCLGGSPGDRSLGDTQAVALEPLDDEALLAQVLERLPDEVITLKANRERVDQSLAAAHPSPRAADMLCQQEATARPQHTPRLTHSRSVVRNGAKGERADHGVKALIVEPPAGVTGRTHHLGTPSRGC
jgi:hypothetical protein